MPSCPTSSLSSGTGCLPLKMAENGPPLTPSGLLLMACGLLQTPPTNLPLLSSLPRSPTRTRSSPRLQHLGLVPLAAVILVLVLLIPMPTKSASPMVQSVLAVAPAITRSQIAMPLATLFAPIMMRTGCARASILCTRLRRIRETARGSEHR